MAKHARISAFEGGRATRGLTQKHSPLVWECILGTVYARGLSGEVKYFDYDYEAAHAFARVSAHSDLRISRATYTYADSPRRGQVALYGIRPEANHV